MSPTPPSARALYTPEERWRRDHTVWTWVQGVLAPVQFLVFLISLVLVCRSLMWGEDSGWAELSVVVKTCLLYAIMVTGCIWEKVVFGQYLFAPSFFWEDVVSMLVMVLHTAYLWAWWHDSLPSQALLWLALAAYASYVINAAQFLLKLRKARLQSDRSVAVASPLNAGALGDIA
jgi:3-vinyl bacteriochlorophyllide hydratase